jgi:hypothetical protein
MPIVLGLISYKNYYSLNCLLKDRKDSAYMYNNLFTIALSDMKYNILLLSKKLF